LFDVEIRLLELTKKHQKLTCADLERSVKGGDVESRLQNLREKNLLKLMDGRIEQSPLQRILLAESLVSNGCDPHNVARRLGWQEFEEFTEIGFEENGFRSIKHLIIKLGRRARREIDILAWNQSFTLAIDCKHWVKMGTTGSRLRQAADSQAKRVADLAQRPEILHSFGLDDAEKRSILPMLLTLGEARMRASAGVPIVPISKLSTFLTELSPFEATFKPVPVEPRHQMRLDLPLP
jgi:restriction endonuclease